MRYKNIQELYEDNTENRADGSTQSADNDHADVKDRIGERKAFRVYIAGPVSEQRPGDTREKNIL